MMTWLTKPLANALTWRNRGRALCILTYHRVLQELDPLRPFEPSARTFKMQLLELKKNFNVLRLDRAIDMLDSNSLPPRAIAITFDDGYLDNHDVALRILLECNVPATFFIATGFLNGGAMFNDIVIEAIRETKVSKVKLPWHENEFVFDTIPEKKATIDAVLPIIKKFPLVVRAQRLTELCDELKVAPISQLMMSPSHVRALYENGMEIGAHTVDHPILSSIQLDEAESQIAASKRDLQSIINAPVRGFAYPNGRPGRDYDPSHVALAEKAGFDYSVSTRWATVTNNRNRFELPRVAPWASSATEFGFRVALSYRDH